GDGRARPLRPAPGRAGARHHQGRLRRAPLPAPPARGRPDPAHRRRAARPAHPRGDRQPLEGRGLLRHGDLPLAPDGPGLRRRGARARPLGAAGDAPVRPGRHADPLQEDLRDVRQAVPPLRHADPAARAVGRQPADILVPRMPDV
ncbi:MAG: Formamidopyrimidine-DNA glycosylase, partial [uncultured Solirubrobacteraceae bacterium]